METTFDTTFAYSLLRGIVCYCSSNMQKSCLNHCVQVFDHFYRKVLYFPFWKETFILLLDTPITKTQNLVSRK